ncbi:MAG: methyltransferase, partial [Bacteroidaceae bacterium]|nr:methyltransferase [Bacteroidaceae bacterium]
MKVGSDSILLGSWMRCVGGHMLDIGTGTGILALMAAQKNNDADIVAIDIDADSAAEASENFASSPWSDRISSKHISLADFTNSTYEKFDTIFSNPPYFEGDLKSPDERRAQARQAETLSHDHLIDSVVKLLEKGGFFSLVLPFSQSNSFVLKAVGKVNQVIQVLRIRNLAQDLR